MHDPIRRSLLPEEFNILDGELSGTREHLTEVKAVMERDFRIVSWYWCNTTSVVGKVKARFRLETIMHD